MYCYYYVYNTYFTIILHYSTINATTNTNSNYCHYYNYYTEEYLHYCIKYPVHHMKCVRSHIMKMLHRYTTVHIELRDLIGTSHTIDDYFGVCNRVRTLMHESKRCDNDYTCSWYMRYRQTLEINQNGEEIIINKPVYTSKDKLVDVTTSFSHGEGENCWGNEQEGGIFDSLFG